MGSAVILIAREFIWLIGIALVIATPLTWYLIAMEQNFTLQAAINHHKICDRGGLPCWQERGSPLNGGSSSTRPLSQLYQARYNLGPPLYRKRYKKIGDQIPIQLLISILAHGILVGNLNQQFNHHDQELSGDHASKLPA